MMCLRDSKRLADPASVAKIEERLRSSFLRNGAQRNSCWPVGKLSLKRREIFLMFFIRSQLPLVVSIPLSPSGESQTCRRKFALFLMRVKPETPLSSVCVLRRARPRRGLDNTKGPSTLYLLRVLLAPPARPLSLSVCLWLCYRRQRHTGSAHEYSRIQVKIAIVRSTAVRPFFSRVRRRCDRNKERRKYFLTTYE